MRPVLSEALVSQLRAHGYRMEPDSVLGRGNQGTVWRGTAPDGITAVAIKWSRSTEAARQEIRALQTFRDNPHVGLPVLCDVFTDVRGIAIVMNLVDGLPLHTVLMKSTRNAPALQQKCRAALDHAHRLGVQHNDLHRMNVLVCRDERGAYTKPVLIDWGSSTAPTADGQRRDRASLANFKTSLGRVGRRLPNQNLAMLATRPKTRQ